METTMLGDIIRKSRYNPLLAEELAREAELEEQRKALKSKPKKVEKVVIEKRKLEQEVPEINPTPANINGPENYLILPGRTHGNYSYPDLLVSQGKDYLGKTWTQSQKLLNKDNAYMLTIRQFVDFLDLLKSGKAFNGKGNKVDSRSLTNILNEISKVTGDWRAEWLDASFSVGPKKNTISYHQISPNGRLKEVTKDLENCLMENREPGISMDSWIKTADYHGLPTSKTGKGSIHYWNPMGKAVARFDAYSDVAVLDCLRDPADADASIGVRVVRKKI